jgi:6-phosphogluconolactonase
MIKLRPDGRTVLNVFDDFEDLSFACANHVKLEIERLDYNLNLILPGGSTPHLLLNKLSSIVTNWQSIKVLLSDERLVSLKSLDSNTAMIKRELIDKIQKHKPDFFEMYRGNYDTEEEMQINLELSSIVGDNGNMLAVLGFGSDGHTASIFPFQRLIEHENETCCFTLQRPNETFKRRSLSTKMLLGSSNIIYLLKGKDKARRLYETILGDFDPAKNPVQRFTKNHAKPVEFFCDRAAAGLFI